MNASLERAPVHLWVVGLAALLWNGFGAYDYLMTRLRNADYLASMGMDPAMILAYIDAMPIWSQFGWGLGVWGSVLGALLLLLRSRFAVHAFIAAFIGMVISLGYQLVDGSAPAEMHEGAMQYMPLVIMAVGLALLWYAWRQRAAGVLR